MKGFQYIRFGIQGLHDVLDHGIQEGLAEHNLSCKRGCYYCCKIVALTALAEGINMAVELLGMPRARRLEVTERLRYAAVPLGMSNKEYAQLGHHCGFLDMDTKDCTIYQHRPASCRFHFVTSPPEECIPGETRKIHMVNLLHMEAVVHQASQTMTGQLLVAPLPNMVLHCLVQLDPTKRKAAVGVPGPVEWTEAYQTAQGQEVEEMRRAIAWAGEIKR